MENVLIIQNDPAFIQEDGDIARLVACKHSFNKVPDLMSRRVIFKPFMVDNLNVVSVPVEDDNGDRNVDVWIDITLGIFPDTEPIEGPIKIGDNLTMSIYVKDTANNTDIRVKDCYAYDNIKSAKNNIKPSQLQLSEESGCPLREQLMGVWRRTLNTMDTGATMIAFNYLKAFKFPEKDSVFLACNIDLCRENCTERCEAEPQNPDEEPPMNDDMMNQDQPSEQGLGSDYEDPNNVGSTGRGSIAQMAGRRGNPQPRGNPQQPRGRGQPQNRNRPGNPQQQRPQQRQPPNRQLPNRQSQQPPQQQRNQPQRPPGPQPRQPQRNGPSQRQPPPQSQQQPQGSRGRFKPPVSSFNVKVQHKQNQLQSSPSRFDSQTNLQSIEQPTNNGSPPDVIEQQQTNLSQGSIAKIRPLGRQSKNSRTIGRTKKSGIFGPPQQFSPLPASQPASQPAATSQLDGDDLPSQLDTPLPTNSPLSSPNNGQLKTQKRPSNLNLFKRQPLSNIQTNDLQSSSSSGQITKVENNVSPQLNSQSNQSPNLQSSRLRTTRKVVRKKAKASSFLDKNNLPLEGLISAASESIESRHSYAPYIPALPVDFEENNNFGARLSKSA